MTLSSQVAPYVVAGEVTVPLGKATGKGRAGYYELRGLGSGLGERAPEVIVAS